ncbi:hypothetical protein OTU49_005096, partial [Cherax quadricarinatus]
CLYKVPTKMKKFTLFVCAILVLCGLSLIVRHVYRQILRSQKLEKETLEKSIIAFKIHDFNLLTDNNKDEVFECSTWIVEIPVAGLVYESWCLGKQLEVLRRRMEHLNHIRILITTKITHLLITGFILTMVYAIYQAVKVIITARTQLSSPVFPLERQALPPPKALPLALPPSKILRLALPKPKTLPLALPPPKALPLALPPSVILPLALPQSKTVPAPLPTPETLPLALPPPETHQLSLFPPPTFSLDQQYPQFVFICSKWFPLETNPQHQTIANQAQHTPQNNLLDKAKQHRLEKMILKKECFQKNKESWKRMKKEQQYSRRTWMPSKSVNRIREQKQVNRKQRK